MEETMSDDDCKDCWGCMAREVIDELRNCGHDDVTWRDLLDVMASCGVTLRRSSEISTYYLTHGLSQNT